MRKILILVSLFFSLSLIISCSPRNTPNPRLDVSMNVNEVTLTRLWEAVSEEAGIREETARINDFRLTTDKKGLIEQAFYVFTALNSESQPMSYLIGADKSGELQISSGNITVSDYDSSDSHYHNPTDMFSRIDKIGLPFLQSGSEGINIRLDYVSDLLYQSNPPQWLLFELKDGTLVPLESVKPEPGYSTALITIDKKNSDQPSQEWFLSEDLARAEIVEYASN